MVNKLERLLNLTAVLLDTRRPLSAEDLRQRVEGYPPPGPAFHRTFERDKEDLRVMGIPLTVERVPASNPPVDGYRINPGDYYLADPDLLPDELAALHLASMAVRLDGLGGQEALWKLGGVIDTGGMVVEQSVSSLPTDPALVPLFQAIIDRNQVAFAYRGQIRHVDPWRLHFQRGRWYLVGYDHLRQDERNYRLDRIEDGVEATGQRAASVSPGPAPSGGPQPAWELGDDEPVPARVLIDADQVSSARRQLGPAASEETRSDGSVVFTVPVVNFEAFRTFLFGFLHRAELLEPLAWRQEIVRWLETIEEGRG
jgi:predicted DNA-binding transcriptional regulator YafY